jgi:hypothetical protein
MSNEIYHLSDEFYDRFYFGAEQNDPEFMPIIVGLKATFKEMKCRKGLPENHPFYGDNGFIVKAKVLGGSLDGMEFTTLQEADGHPWLLLSNPEIKQKSI